MATVEMRRVRVMGRDLEMPAALAERLVARGRATYPETEPASRLPSAPPAPEVEAAVAEPDERAVAPPAKRPAGRGRRKA